MRYAKPRVIRGTRVKPLPLLPSGPGGVRSRPLHEARSLTIHYRISFAVLGLAGQAWRLTVPWRRRALSASVHELNSENGFVLQNGQRKTHWPQMNADARR